MSIRSMTGFAQVRGQADEQHAFTLSLKSVNHRFLDLHLRLPAETDALEMKIRRLVKEKLARGHIEVMLSLEQGQGVSLALNRQLAAAYVKAFRDGAQEFGLGGEPDLNVIFRLPGALQECGMGNNGAFDATVLEKLEEAIGRLDQMRAEEGKAIERELRERLAKLRSAAEEVDRMRGVVLCAYMDRLQSRLQELTGAQVSQERLLQEAALLAERSDIQEEVVRMKTHIEQFLALLDHGNEVGKKLDFLLQEMGREANTLLSKTSGVAGEALKITQYGLSMKAEIEKLREQVQNVE